MNFTAVAILVGCGLLAASIAFVFRWDLIPITGGAFRLDRWSGEIRSCQIRMTVTYLPGPGNRVECDP